MGRRTGLQRTLLTGNVHDTVSAFTAGAIDLLVCYHQAAQPLPLDLARFDCLTLGGDIIRPYASHRGSRPAIGTCRARRKRRCPC